MAQDAVFPIQAHWQSVNSEIEALNHFKQSPFYSKDCNNESPEIPLNDLGSSVLSRMTGYEYVVDSEASKKPILWVFLFRYRVSPAETSNVAAYYLLFGNIYQAPQALHLIESRLSKATYHIEEAMDALSMFKQDAEVDIDIEEEEECDVLAGAGQGLSSSLHEELHREYLKFKQSL